MKTHLTARLLALIRTRYLTMYTQNLTTDSLPYSDPSPGRCYGNGVCKGSPTKTSNFIQRSVIPKVTDMISHYHIKNVCFTFLWWWLPWHQGSTSHVQFNVSQLTYGIHVISTSPVIWFSRHLHLHINNLDEQVWANLFTDDRLSSWIFMSDAAALCLLGFDLGVEFHLRIRGDYPR